MLKETKHRIINEQITDPLDIAYLVKGITSLKTKIGSNERLIAYEEDVRGSLINCLNERHDVVNKFDPYSISKVLRYCLAYNDSSEGATELYKSLSLLLSQTIIEREASFKSDVDTLIDLETKDILDIVRVYSAFSKND